MPRDQVRRLAVAARLIRGGHLELAERYCALVVEDRPWSLQARWMRAKCKFIRRSSSAASRQLSEIAGSGPSSVASLLLLATAKQKEEKYSEAAEWARKALNIAPENVEAIRKLALCCYEFGDYEEAEQHWRSLATLDPQQADLHYYLGLTLRALGDNSAAIGEFERAAEADNSTGHYRISLIEALLDGMDEKRALSHARLLQERWPEDAMGYILAAQALSGEGLGTEAELEARKAVRLGPMDDRAHANLGLILSISGKMEEAQRYNRSSIELEPWQGLAYLNYVRSGRVTEEDRSLVRQMEELEQDPLMPEVNLASLAYALGKAHEDLGQYESSMRHYDHANELVYRLKFGTRPFDLDTIRTQFEALQERFSAGFLTLNEGVGIQDSRPILVVGMMRSGTTLVEQILSSHPDVGGAGERRFWPQNRNAPFDPASGELQPDRLRELAGKYCSLLASLTPETAFTVDKLPGNYQNLGLIHLALPQAKIIHIRRHPVDVGLSIYSTPNRARIGWAHDKDNIAHVYRSYQQLANHWRQVLPKDRVFEVHYEDLVSSPDSVIPRMVEYCGLEWSESCLHPERNERSVSTPSVWQVRQPIYKTSMARWKRFEPWLGSLVSLDEAWPAGAYANV